MSENLVADPPPAAPDGRPRRSQPAPGDAPRWKTVLPIALGAVLLLLGLLFGYLALRMAQHHTRSFGQEFVSIFVPPPAAVFGKERIYLLVLGIDYNYDDKGMPYSKDARSDTIIAAGLDFPSKSLKLVSVLRDTEATVAGRDTKINEAYRIGGEPLSDRIVGDFLGMPTNERGRHFDRSVVVKINAVKDFVNAIGGIDVPVTERMDYDDNWGHLHIHFKPGLVHMNGEDAQAYARFRHDACSDPCRTKRQQQVIHLVIQKLKNEKFNDLTHIAQLIDVVHRDVITDLSNDEMKSLGWAFKDANNADLAKADTIGYVDTKTAADGGEVLIPDEQQKTKLVAALLGAYGNVTPPPASALAAIKPSTIHLIVENGSGEPGLATTAAARLERAGYVIDSVRNADAFSYDATQIRSAAARIPLAGERVRKDLGVDGATVMPATDATPGPQALVTVIVGKDFVAQTVPKTAPTSSAAPLRR